jgi:hypothetical protein
MPKGNDSDDSIAAIAEITLRVKLNYKKQHSSGLEVELRDDGFYYGTYPVHYTALQCNAIQYVSLLLPAGYVFGSNVKLDWYHSFKCWIVVLFVCRCRAAIQKVHANLSFLSI